METRKVKVYRCNQCAARIRRAEARQEHLHWHRIVDKNFDAYFTEVEEDDDTAIVPTPADARTRATRPPSTRVLVVGVATVVLAGVVYWLAS